MKDTLVEEILQQGDTAIIYPEAPEDEQSPAETGGADENGNLDNRTTPIRRLLWVSGLTSSSLSQEPLIPSPNCTPAPTAPGATSATPR